MIICYSAFCRRNIHAKRRKVFHFSAKLKIRFIDPIQLLHKDRNSADKQKDLHTSILSRQMSSVCVMKQRRCVRPAWCCCVERSHPEPTWTTRRSWEKPSETSDTTTQTKVRDTTCLSYISAPVMGMHEWKQSLFNALTLHVPSDCLKVLTLRPVTCWWPWRSSLLTSLREFTSTVWRVTSELETRSNTACFYEFGPSFGFWRTCAHKIRLKTIESKTNMTWLVSFCADRVWCSDTPQMRQRSVCPSPSSSHTNSTPRWPSWDVTGPSPGSAQTPRHRWGPDTPAENLQNHYWENAHTVQPKWTYKTLKTIMQWWNICLLSLNLQINLL